MGDNTVIIGAGEVGANLYGVLRGYHDTDIYDIDGKADGKLADDAKIEVVNICLPFNDQFVDTAETYIKRFKPSLVIIHSTVAPGTTDALNKHLGDICVHSPVIGRHPDLKAALHTFTKMYAGPLALRDKVARYFLEASMSCMYMGEAVVTELGKLLDTTYYGLCLVWHQQMKAMADVYGVDFSKIRNYNNVYNEGYARMGIKVQRPVLDAMAFKGHCIGPNLELLRELFPDNLLLEQIEVSNSTFVAEQKVLVNG